MVDEKVSVNMTNTSVSTNEAGIEPIPLDKRESWVPSCIVWAGCEFAFSVIMTGAGIISSFSLQQFLLILIFTLVVITWPTDGLNSYLGALTGRSSTVITRASFGAHQSRIIISILITFNLVGWWAIQTAITGNAICTMFNIDYTVQKGAWIIATIIAGILFAIPPILGYTSMKIIDYVAVPGGIILCVTAFYLSVKDIGLANMWSYNPEQTMLTTEAVSLIVAANVSQLVIMADYTRFVRPKVKDSFLVPIGVLIVGFILFVMGAVMGLGKGTFDIVAIMKDLGFGWWGFLVLWLAQWTSQLVCVYSMGLSLSNLFNANTEKQRKIFTAVGSVIALIVALLGILDKFTDFLYLTGLLFPAVGSIMVVDYFLINKKTWEDKKGWNWNATIAMVAGIIVGYYTQYVQPMGIPAIQSYLISGVLFYVLTYFKAKTKPDIYSPQRWITKTNI